MATENVWQSSRHGRLGRGGGSRIGIEQTFQQHSHSGVSLCFRFSVWSQASAVVLRLWSVELKRLLAGDPGPTAASRWRLRLRLQTALRGESCTFYSSRGCHALSRPPSHCTQGVFVTPVRFHLAAHHLHIGSFTSRFIDV